MVPPSSLRDALIRQWQRIASAIPPVDLDAPSRVSGWRNREVVAHLALQPSLLEGFLGTARVGEATRLSLAANLAGTVDLREVIDAAARRASSKDLDFAGRMDRTLQPLVDADLSATVTTLQGPIALVDYLRTRCVEAAVHGGDLSPPAVPDDEALAIAADALIEALSARRPDLVRAARALPAQSWVDQATGRSEPSGPLLDALPVVA